MLAKLGALHENSYEDNKGVSVLHIILEEGHQESLNRYVNEYDDDPTISNVIKTLKKMEIDKAPGQEFTTLAYKSLENMIKEESGVDISEYHDTPVFDKYELPEDLLSVEEYEKDYLEKVLFPEMRKITPHPIFDSYENFMKCTWTGYTVGMDINEYWDKYWAKKTTFIPVRYTLPEKALIL